MGYVEANLLPDEKLVHKATLHWLIFWKALLVTALGIVFVVIQPAIGLMVVVIGLVMFLPPWIARRTSEFGVTTKRVIVKTGLVQRRTLELLLRQIEAISVDQGLMGRVFNYGSITLSGTGGVREVFHNIAAPLELRRHIHSQTA